MMMANFCWPILLADEIGQLYRSFDISLSLYHINFRANVPSQT